MTRIGLIPAPLFTTQNVVTGSRSLTTVFQNTTGKPIFVNVGVTATATGTVDALTDRINPPTTVVYREFEGLIGATMTLSFIVLPNNFYRVVVQSGAFNLTLWVEWT